MAFGDEVADPAAALDLPALTVPEPEGLMALLLDTADRLVVGLPGSAVTVAVARLELAGSGRSERFCGVHLGGSGDYIPVSKA